VAIEVAFVPGQARAFHRFGIIEAADVRCFRAIAPGQRRAETVLPRLGAVARGADREFGRLGGGDGRGRCSGRRGSGSRRSRRARRGCRRRRGFHGIAGGGLVHCGAFLRGDDFFAGGRRDFRSRPGDGDPGIVRFFGPAATRRQGEGRTEREREGTFGRGERHLGKSFSNPVRHGRRSPARLYRRTFWIGRA